MHGRASCILPHALDTDFLQTRRAGLTPDIWPEKLTTPIPIRTGPQIAAELAGRKLIRFALTQFDDYDKGGRDGKETWLTLTPACAQCSGVFFHLPRERVERHWAILVDPEKVGDIEGPRRCQMGYGFEYRLPHGYINAAWVHPFGTYVGDPGLPETEDIFGPVSPAALNAVSAQFYVSLGNVTFRVAYEASERHTILEWAAEIDQTQAWDTFVALGLWETKPNTERYGVRGSVAQMHGDDKYVRNFTDHVIVENSDYRVLQRSVQGVLGQALDVGQGNLSNDSEAQRIPSMAAFRAPWPGPDAFPPE